MNNKNKVYRSSTKDYRSLSNRIFQGRPSVRTANEEQRKGSWTASKKTSKKTLEDLISVGGDKEIESKKEFETLCCKRNPGPK